MQSFSDVWKDCRSRHVQGRVAEVRAHCLAIAESYIPDDKLESYRKDIEEEKDRLSKVYEWADTQDVKRESLIIFGDL